MKDLEKWAKKGKANITNMAYLRDRVNKNLKMPQIYGTQVFRNKFGKYEVYPTIDTVKLNERRRSVGLSSIEKYLKTMDNLK